MKFIWLLGAIAIVGAVEVNAQQARATLWKDIFVGMTSTELQSRYPAKKGTIKHKKQYSIIEDAIQIGECSPSVAVEYPNGFVTEVIIRSAPKGFFQHMCGNEAESELLVKYGQPTSKDESSQKKNGLYTGGAIGRDVRNIRMLWTTGSTLITFVRDDPDQEDYWSIKYAPITSSGL